MMTPKAAAAVLRALGEGEAKKGRMLAYNLRSSWAYCPSCGTAQMHDMTFDFTAMDGRTADGNDGLQMIFYINHPSIGRRCLWGFAGVPAQGPIAAAILNAGEALQVLTLEEKMMGRQS